ncbi:MAG: DUF3365 domain-containing protein [Candidatus Dadabacteria bacterium]|nr:MAG: DUF3365 domain-containing protein [Candidatus Dadabacteria bacterium]
MSSKIPGSLLLLSAILLWSSFPVNADTPPSDKEITQKTGREEIIEKGEEAAKRLIHALKAHLTKAIKSKGVVSAVKYCSLAAEGLSGSVNDTLKKDGVNVKRVSDRFRNPANKPDRTDLVAIRYFRDSLKRDSYLPPYYITKQGAQTRYYKPIRIGKLCLKCHGTEKDIPKAVAKYLREHYPEDRATGYKEGDLRGVIRVTLNSN